MKKDEEKEEAFNSEDEVTLSKDTLNSFHIRDNIF